MTTFHVPENDALTTVAAARTAGDPALVLADGSAFGTVFPKVVTVTRGTLGEDTLVCRLEVTGRTGATLAVAGAAEGTADADLLPGDHVFLAPTKLAMTEIHGAIAALEATAAGLGTASTHPAGDFQPADADLTALAVLAHAKGQVIADTGAAWAALAPGADTQVLTLDSTTATGVKWATPAAGGVAIGDAVTGGTAGRVLFEGTGPVVADSANLTFDGTTLTLRSAATATLIRGLNPAGGQTWTLDTDGTFSGGGLLASTYVSTAYVFASHIVAATDRTGSTIEMEGGAVAVCVGAAKPAFAARGAAGQTAPLVPLQGISSLPATKDLGYLAAGFVGGDPADATYLGFVTVAATGWNGIPREGLRVASDGTKAIVTLSGSVLFSDAATARTNLGLGTAATHPATDFAPAGAGKFVFELPEGNAAVGTDQAMTYPIVPVACTCAKVWVSAKIAPTGASLILDILKSSNNGSSWTSLWATTPANRPTLAAGSNNGSTTSFDTTALSAGDWLRIDVAQVGSTVAGSGVAAVLAIT